MGGSAVRLVRQIPYTLACDLLLTGRHITAAEAKEMGLIGHVVPDGQALTKALELADAISANGPLAVQAILRSIRETECMPENEAFKIDTRSASRSSCPTTPRKARARSPRSAQLPEPLGAERELRARFRPIFRPQFTLDGGVGARRHTAIVIEPFLGSEAIASGALTRHRLRSAYATIHPDVYVSPAPT